MWNALFPGNAEEAAPLGVTTATTARFDENPLNLAFIQMGSTLVALDGATGKVAWQWPVPSNVTLVSLSGWGDTLAVVAQGEPFQSPYFPTPTTPTVLMAINATEGTTMWWQNATQVVPQTQAEAASYAVENFIAGEDQLFYCRASKLAAVSKDGTVVWRSGVSLDSSGGLGQAANITHLRYIPRRPSSEDPADSVPPRLLANANNWSFQRFVLLGLNDTNSSVAATSMWRSRVPETSMDSLYLSQPVVDPWTSSGMFYYWSNRTEWPAGGVPTWSIKLVGRDLRDGSELWKSDAQPVGLPAVFEGRVFAMTGSGLAAMEGVSGSTVWQIAGTAPSEYSYELSPTFGNTTGLLVASRCLAPAAPNLCMYSAFQPESGAVRMRTVAALVVAALATLASAL